MLGTRRVGHAGTLDPMATGLLVLLFGEATKLSSVLTTDSKEYEATVEFGVGTLSLDADGPIVRRTNLEPDWLARAPLAQALEAERARTVQVPPQVSAIQVDGKRSYQRVRAGEEVALEPRSVLVHELETVELSGLRLKVRLRVSKGYYVRAFARDLGDHLGVPAHLVELRRTRSGPFTVDKARTLEHSSSADLLSIAEVAKASLPCVLFDEPAAERLRQGKLATPLTTSEEFAPGELVAAFVDERLIALVEAVNEVEARALSAWERSVEELQGRLFRVRRGFQL